jgi:hypothetical protein
MESLWKAIAEIKVEPGDLGLDSSHTKGFMNLITWASSPDLIREKLSRYLGSFNWELLSLEDIRRVDDSSTYGEELTDMIERARPNPNAIILGCFHSYRETLQ